MNTKQAWSDVDSDFVKRYLLGGAAVGGGTAMIVGLLNHLNSQNRKPAVPETLKVVLPSGGDDEEEQRKFAFVRGALGISGGALTAGGGYMLVRKLMQELKKKELEREVEDAQSIYVDALSPKTANAADILQGAPGALLIASLLGSGMLTYKGLDKAFPAMRPPNVEAGAKRVEFVRDTDRDGNIEETDEKEVDYMTPSTKAAAIGGVAYAITKLASDGGAKSEFVSLVEAAANGRMQEISDVIRSAGVEAGLDIVKGASCSDMRKCALAARALCADPIIGPAITLLASAEMQEAAPGVCKVAQAMMEHEPDLSEQMQKVAVAVSVAETADSLLPKGGEDATAYDGLPGAMDALMTRPNGNPA